MQLDVLKDMKKQSKKMEFETHQRGMNSATITSKAYSKSKNKIIVINLA
jgi:hypothetical protein